MPRKQNEFSGQSRLHGGPNNPRKKSLFSRYLNRSSARFGHIIIIIIQNNVWTSTRTPDYNNCATNTNNPDAHARGAQFAFTSCLLKLYARPTESENYNTFEPLQRNLTVFKSAEYV